MAYSVDVIVIGAGPGGYVAAIRCAQLGFSVAIIEKQETLGGTCLNWGCIPSKALLDSSEQYHNAVHKFNIHGIEVEKISVNLKQMMKRKRAVVETTTKGIAYLMKKNNIRKITGEATFVDSHTIKVITNKEKTEISAEHIIIATGSKVTPLPSVPVDGKSIITSNEAISLPTVPKHMIVIGGGVIGVELGSVYGRLGSKITVVEYMDRLIPGMDKDLGKTLQRSLKKQYEINYHFNTKVIGSEKKGNEVIVTAEDQSGKEIKISGDVVLVSIGRQANTENLGLEEIGIPCDKQGRVIINDQYQTAISHIYAIGDVVRGAMLAHKASEEGVICAEIIAGNKGHLNDNAIPGVVYTWPEVASVGKTEEECKKENRAIKIGKFPFKASGRARAAEESEGFVKVIADKQTDEVLGVHMIGPRAADMIAEAVLAIEYRASAEDIALTVHPHPSFTEAIKEAALEATENRPIHL